MNPNIKRGAIKGRQGNAVWDFLSLSGAPDAKKFTKYPHLTLGITATQVEAMVTLPHQLNTPMRRAVRQLGENSFRDLVKDVVAGFKPLVRKHEGLTPSFRGVQRRYLTQSSTPFMDAQIDFDLRRCGSLGPAFTVYRKLNVTAVDCASEANPDSTLAQCDPVDFDWIPHKAHR